MAPVDGGWVAGVLVAGWSGLALIEAIAPREPREGQPATSTSVAASPSVALPLLLLVVAEEVAQAFQGVLEGAGVG